MGCLLEKLKRLKLNRVEQLQQRFVDQEIQIEEKQLQTFIPLQIIAYANEQRIVELQKKTVPEIFRQNTMRDQKNYKNVKNTKQRTKEKEIMLQDGQLIIDFKLLNSFRIFNSFLDQKCCSI